MRNWIGLTLLPLPLLLAGCGDDGGDKAKSAGTAVGEILPGSASDAMIPVDQVKSQSPLAPKVDEGGKADASPAEKGKPTPQRSEPAEPPAADEPADAAEGE